ncbi:hypothetical protein VTL71DRAFT_11224 [Oculimacula yallundae]|uniref:Uncharacterized protein n=1 Tax=Oculimacula yallundae TaxID=86028 RepID=A0ABR4CX11_9HELO
MVKINRVINL